MNISSKRFVTHTNKTYPGKCFIRDKNAPYHEHTILISDLPHVNELALMSENSFDQLITTLIYK